MRAYCIEFGILIFEDCGQMFAVQIIRRHMAHISGLDFKSCREEIAGALQEICNRWCKREHVECNALNSWTYL